MKRFRIIIVFLAGLSVFASCRQTSATEQEMPSDFVILAEAVPDIIQEIRYYSTYNFVGARVDGYEAPVAIMTRKAAEALKEVSDDVIAQGYCLKVFDAYRPQKAVAHFVRWAKDLEDVRMKPSFYPDVDKSLLFELGYIAEYSGHSRGSTVDLTLVDIATGKEVDMGGPFCARRCYATDSNRLTQNGGISLLPKSHIPIHISISRSKSGNWSK